MQTGLRGRDLIALSDWTNEEIETALDVAFDLKRKRALGERHAYLLDKTLAMLFFFSSTRTRCSRSRGNASRSGKRSTCECSARSMRRWRAGPAATGRSYSSRVPIAGACTRCLPICVPRSRTTRSRAGCVGRSTSIP